MRFNSFELQRYGHFSDRKLVFPQRATDFHLIYGNNEAGKSTLRQAFHDLLFGIPMKSSMAFLHAGTDLALNAVLSGKLGELAMGRRRKKAGGLVDAAGERLPDEVWARWLEGVTPAFHERMFGLDHQRLEHGSRAMLQAGDDVDAVLFQAAAGLATLNGVLSAVREEAAGLWTPHHSRSRAWYAAHDRYKEAEKALKAATVRPTAWVTAERESRRADLAFVQARERCADLRTRILTIERLRRLAPLVVQIQECEQLVLEQGRLEGSPLLELEADILALEETRLRVAGHADDIAQCESQIGLLREQLGHVYRQLGRSLPDDGLRSRPLESLAAALPPLPLRREITQLLSEGQALRRQRDGALQARDAQVAEVQELGRRIAALPAVAVGEALRRSLQAATAAGDIVGTLAALERQLAHEESVLMQRLQALRQPELDTAFGLEKEQGIDTETAKTILNELARMQAWPGEALADYAQQRQALRANLDAAGRRLRDAELDLNAARLKVEQFRRSHQAVSLDQVLAARRDRDALWQIMLADEHVFKAQAQDFAAKVLLADTLVDRHLQAVDDAARLQALEQDCERLQLTLKGLEETKTAASHELQAFDEGWRQGCQRRGLPLLLPAALQGWLPAREAALSVYERLLTRRAEFETLNARHQTLLQQLKAALSAEDADLAPQVDQAGLGEACELARQLLAQADSAAARRQALSEQLQRLEPLLPGLQRDGERAELAYAQWLSRRTAALQRAGLPEDADDAYVESAIGLLAEADSLMGRLREREAQRDQCAAELQAFSQNVETLAQRLKRSHVPMGSAAEYVRAWVAELAPLRAAERDREQARQRLQGLLASLHEAAEGRNRKQVEAELAEVDVATLPAAAEDLRLQLEVAEQEQDRMALERQNALHALETISGSDDAARAEAMRQEALADMGEAAEAFVRVYAQQRLLEHITERYRERSQGPLLVNAGRRFSQLTLQAYSGLEIDGDEATLLARRADGRPVPLHGLSDGTRDQLYLALRLAALELYLSSAPPLPFIADDLFINYDDRRSLAGLQQLVEISRRTQVIFLTHHAHLVELAREHLADAVQVIELGLPE